MNKDIMQNNRRLEPYLAGKGDKNVSIVREYAWTAKTPGGFTTEGICRCADESDLRRILKDQGYLPLTIQRLNVRLLEK